MAYPSKGRKDPRLSMLEDDLPRHIGKAIAEHLASKKAAKAAPPPAEESPAHEASEAPAEEAMEPEEQEEEPQTKTIYGMPSESAGRAKAKKLAGLLGAKPSKPPPPSHQKPRVLGR